MSDEISTVKETVLAYVACSEGFNFAARKGLWDADEDTPVLCPEESPEPLIGWDALDAYWSHSRKSMASLVSKATNIKIRMLSDTLALATYNNRWIATMAEAEGLAQKPISADVRMTAVLRKTDAGWRYIHLVEGPVDLMTMARQSANRMALELFPELKEKA